MGETCSVLGKMRHACEFLVGEPKRKRPLWRNQVNLNKVGV